MAPYPLARLRFPGRDVVFMLSRRQPDDFRTAVVLVPQYVLVSGWAG